MHEQGEPFSRTLLLATAERDAATIMAHQEAERRRSGFARPANRARAAATAPQLEGAERLNLDPMSATRFIQKMRQGSCIILKSMVGM